MSLSLYPLEWIELRCDRDEDDGCLLWRQYVSRTGAPVASKDQPDGRRPTIQLRRNVWEVKNGPIPAGKVVAVSCGNPRCLEHLELMSKADVVRRQWTKQDERAKLTAATTRANRKRAKLDMDKAREIRLSSETLEQISARLGISVALASMVRRGERWTEGTASPFAGLGAR